jgi:hypothetical protein
MYTSNLIDFIVIREGDSGSLKLGETQGGFRELLSWRAPLEDAAWQFDDRAAPQSAVT